MNSLERFYATVSRKPVDRPASWLGIPDSKALPALFRYFGVNDIKGLKRKLGDDIWPVDLPYHSPVGDAIYAAFDFAKEKHGKDERTLTARGFFEDHTDPATVDDFDWPDPESFISPEACRQAVEVVPEGCAALGVVWSAHFQDACAAFGMENALITMLSYPEMFRAVIDRITEFYLLANGIFYEATKGNLHAVLIGNDFGSQTGLMVSPCSLREFVLPGTRKLIQQAKSYGLTVFHHSCGAIYPVIDDLVDAGADVIHPIQALATGMEPQRLKDSFGSRVSFCGGVDAQRLLPFGKPEDVRAKVRELIGIFPTGLIVSPSHEAILQDIPPANIEALFSSLQP
jgi:uroporphyrinogen decarboxylase